LLQQGHVPARRAALRFQALVAKCVFCDIVSGQVAAASVYDDPQTLAFLDHAPLLPGHVLVVPKAHVATLDDLPPEALAPYFGVVQRISRAVQAAFKAHGSFVAANIRISQSVPHLHFHVVPRNKGDGLFGRNFMWIRKPYPSEAAMSDAQAAIRAALQA
jgi:histidine triad (HIT) family protein